jgi:hypothetical protein
MSPPQEQMPSGRLPTAERAAAPVSPPAAVDPAVPGLTGQVAQSYVRLAMAGVQREYPNVPQYHLAGPHDLRPPRAEHPAFYGCYDWHSAVHTHWLLARLGRLYPELAEPAAAVLRRHLTGANLAVETAYCADRPGFERPYGSAWLLTLAAELAGWNHPEAAGWARAVQPLAAVLAGNLAAWLAAERYPIRHGVHGNTAFALSLVWDAAPPLREVAGAAALRWYADDTGYDARYEPSAHDFVSPALTEAVLMSRVLPAERYGGWLAAFLPGLPGGEPAGLLAPVEVSDRADPQGVHRDGLNLSRAWCLRRLAAVAGPDDPRTAVLAAAAQAHLAAALPHVASGDFVGEHWLPTFAVLALTG